jgi:hypothetical protein
MVMLPRDCGRCLAVNELLLELNGLEGERGLSGDDTKFGELKEREGARSPGRRGASKVGVVGVGDC